jgi:hypothetical protein
VANGACEGSPGACERLSVLVFREVSCSTWDGITAERYMVRRRSTVRFRKGAPGCERFSNMEPSTSFGGVAFEWQTPSRTGPCDQAICCWMAAQSDSCLGKGPGLARHSAHTGRATSGHAGPLRVTNALGQGPSASTDGYSYACQEVRMAFSEGHFWSSGGGVSVLGADKTGKGRS